MTEKSGGPQRTQRQMDGFREAVNLCGFQDLGFLGLDRAFANSDWSNKFSNCKVYHVVDSTSDHCILRITDSIASPPRRNRRFHYEALWAKRDDCYDIVESAWNRGSLENTPEGIASNLSLCASALTLWSRDVIGNIPKKIQEHKKLLNTLTTLDRDGSHSVEINEVRKDLNGLLDSEEVLWHQRSKIHWYREGDRNTKFFHFRASERRRKNFILGLWNDDDCWCNDKDSIACTAVDYFTKIYTSCSPNRIEEVINTIPTRVTDDMNAELTKTFTSEEVLRALHQIHLTKSPGPDSMSAIFFQRYWNIVGRDITNMVLNVLNFNLPMTEINKTNIALIPKTNHPARMTEFWPISLCNVTYKLISKVLANRLKAILPYVIAENQSAFTADRLITDNVLVAFELMHYLNHKIEGKDGFMSIKLDMSKAFDQVEWGFIKRVMEKLGFHNN